MGGRDALPLETDTSRLGEKYMARVLDHTIHHARIGSVGGRQPETIAADTVNPRPRDGQVRATGTNVEAGKTCQGELAIVDGHTSRCLQLKDAAGCEIPIVVTVVPPPPEGGGGVEEGRWNSVGIWHNVGMG